VITAIYIAPDVHVVPFGQVSKVFQLCFKLKLMVVEEKDSE